MSSTDTQGPILDCDEAFEELYKCSRRDPSVYDNLAIWRSAWVARQLAMAAPVPAEPLSEEAIRQAVAPGNDGYWHRSKLWITAVARAIEAAHGIGIATTAQSGDKP